ncbi:MAG: hypothetical protein NXI19_00580 [Alphaproteobacteria bacterium]|nr:hypothetical protein [Alphaproteobacteria bacterium]
MTTKSVPTTLSALAVMLMVSACGSSPDTELAALKPYGTERLEGCGPTTHGVELRDLDDDIEDWSIEDATDDLGAPQLADRIGGIKRAGWYDVTLGQANCGVLLVILERNERAIVTVRGLKGQQIWDVLGGQFPN